MKQQAHDTRDGPHKPGTCGACDRARDALEFLDEQFPENTPRHGTDTVHRQYGKERPT